MPEKYLYCIIQTDDDDFYVKCNETATYSEIYKNIPRTNELRCIHGSDVPEGRELTPGISRELFGHDVVAVANNTAAPPWNFEKFKQHVKAIFNPENLEDCDTTLYICVDKKLIHKRTTENCAVLATQHNLFGCGVCGDNITPWNRVIDSDVNFATRCAVRWLDRANANVWNIDKYYARLVSLFGDNLIVRDKTETTDPNFANQVHDRIRVMCSKHEGLIVADEDLVLLTQGTYCPWSRVNAEQIEHATQHVGKLFTETELNQMSEKIIKQISEGTQNKHHTKHPKPPMVLPRSDVPTYKELATWLAEGRGELLDLNNYNTVRHTLDYPLDKENECLHPLDVCYYRVRVKDDITWRKPNIKSMGIQRWDIAKFAVYIASKYEGYVKVSVGLLGPDLYLGNLRLANFATGAVTEIGKSLGELTALTTVPWDKLTDNDVMLLEKDMERIIEEGIPNE
jgi:hypothetical protein